MIGHQHVGRTGQPVSCARVQQHLAKTSVESLVEPTRRAVFNRMRPKHRSASLIPLARQPRQSRFSFERHSPSRFSRSGLPRKPTLQPRLQPDTPTSAPFLVARLVRGGTEPPHHPSLPFASPFPPHHPSRPITLPFLDGTSRGPNDPPAPARARWGAPQTPAGPTLRSPRSLRVVANGLYPSCVRQQFISLSPRSLGPP